MKIRLLSQCKSDWDFSPISGLKKYSPLFCYGDQLLNFPETHLDQNTEVIDLKNDLTDLSHCLKFVYENLSLAELARLFYKTNNFVETEHNLEKISQIFGFRWSSDLIKTLKLLVDTPMSFQNWTSQKQIGLTELAPLRAIKDIQIFAKYLDIIANSQLSKSKGAQVLELIAELFLMNRLEQLDNILEEHWDKWIPLLKAERYPQTDAQDKSAEKYFRSLPWPLRVNAQWLRQGDQGFLEIKLKLENANDLSLKADALKKIASQMKDFNF